MTHGKDIVLLSTAEWNNPFWTNKQHVTVELARQGYRVLYIDSQGIRRATIKSSDMTRIFRRLSRAFRPPMPVRENIYVWSPVPLPFRRLPVVAALNRWLFERLLRHWLRRLRCSRPLFWSYSPLTLQSAADFAAGTDFIAAVRNAIFRPNREHIAAGKKFARQFTYRARTEKMLADIAMLETTGDRS